MPTTRAILTKLSRDELLGVLDAYDLRVSDRRVKDQLVDALAASPEVQGEDILPAFPRARLKALCRAFGLDDGGREKALLVERLAGDAPPPMRPAEVTHRQGDAGGPASGRSAKTRTGGKTTQIVPWI